MHFLMQIPHDTNCFSGFFYLCSRSWKSKLLRCFKKLYFMQTLLQFYFKLLTHEPSLTCFSLLELSTAVLTKISVYDHSNESCRAVLSCGVVYYAVRDGSSV